MSTDPTGTPAYAAVPIVTGTPGTTSNGTTVLATASASLTAAVVSERVAENHSHDAVPVARLGQQRLGRVGRRRLGPLRGRRTEAGDRGGYVGVRHEDVGALQRLDGGYREQPRVAGAGTDKGDSAERSCVLGS